MTAGTLSSSTDTVLDDAASLLDQRDPADRTALMLAASEGHTNLIELFLDKGSVLESRDKEGMTALCWACVRGRLAAVQNLIDHGADVNTNDNTGRTPLDLAAFQVTFFKKILALIIYTRSTKSISHNLANNTIPRAIQSWCNCCSRKEQRSSTSISTECDLWTERSDVEIYPWCSVSYAVGRNWARQPGRWLLENQTFS